jgi:hypothetical protein
MKQERALQFCPIEDRDKIPWAPELPSLGIITHQQFWNAILDPECKNKGRALAVFYEWASTNHGLFGNNCPQEARDKIKGMML